MGKHSRAVERAEERDGELADDTTALLGSGSKDKSPIFLRVCHAPWTSIGQTQLVVLRGLVAAYTLLSFGTNLNYNLTTLDQGWNAIYDLSNISDAVQALYQTVAFIWTFMHLYYPHPEDREDDSDNSEVITRTQEFLSPPRQNNSNNNRGYFSLFYTSAVTWPLVVAFIQWAVLVPQNQSVVPGDQIFGNNDQYTEFYHVSKYIVNAAVAASEVFFLSSVKRQEPVNGHLAGLTGTSAAYIAWAYIGYAFTGEYAYYFFDPLKVGGKEKVAAAIVAFGALTNIGFAFVYGLTGLRESLAKQDSKRKDYQPLPQ